MSFKQDARVPPLVLPHTINIMRKQLVFQKNLKINRQRKTAEIKITPLCPIWN